jgi:transposase
MPPMRRCLRSGGQAEPAVVPVKTEEQQAVLSFHRAPQGFVRQRTTQASQIRGLLSEFAIAIRQGTRRISRHLCEILEESENTLPGAFQQLLRQLAKTSECYWESATGSWNTPNWS